MNDVRENLAEVRRRIDGACARARRPPDAVRLVAVSKLQPVDRVRAAYAAGHRLFGENYVQALAERRAGMPEDVEWHLIGHLQTNKARAAVLAAAVIQTVDSPRIASALAKAASGRAAPLPILIEVNLGGEGSKSGVSEADLPALAEAILAMPALALRGLMTVPPIDDEPRRWFSALREVRDRLAARTGSLLPELSMGMSGDYEDAVLEGATLVRVGSAIFGERDLLGGHR